MNTKIKLFTLLTILTCFITGQSFTDYDLEKTYSEEYALSADGTLDLYNKYGEVKIMTWDQQRTKIDVVVKVDARNDKKAQEMMDRINIEFNSNGNYVSAKTVFDEGDYSNYKTNYNTKYVINYTVYMPANAHLKVFNKYGNTSVEALERTVDAEIKYGNIKMDNVAGDVKLMLGYGNADFKSMRDFNAEVKYSKVRAGDIQNMKMESKYSEFSFDNAANVQIQSKYDTYYFTKVNSLANEGKYDDFRIKELGEMDISSKYTSVDIDMVLRKFSINQKYGGVKIGEMGSDMEEVYLDVEYTNVKIRRVNTGYTLDMDGEYTDYDLHDDFEATMKSDKDDKNIRLKGHYGNGATKIRASMEYGGLRID